MSVLAQTAVVIANRPAGQRPVLPAFDGGTEPAIERAMVHPYPPYCADFAYRGRYSYFLTLVTFERQELFKDSQIVQLALAQILRATSERQFEVLAYCFMPDHLHVVGCGLSDGSDLKSFVRLAKQYSGYYFARAHERRKLWQHGGHDHIIRDDVDLLDRLRYVVNNPVAAGLVQRAEDYPFLGSQRWSLAELIDVVTTGLLTRRSSPI